MASVLHTISDFDFVKHKTNIYMSLISSNIKRLYVPVLVNTQKNLTSVQLKVPSHRIISSPIVVTMVVKISEIKMAKKYLYWF